MSESSDNAIFVRILTNYPNIFKRPTSKAERAKQEIDRIALTNRYNEKCLTNLSVKQISKKVNNMKARIKEKSSKDTLGQKRVRYTDFEKLFLSLWSGQKISPQKYNESEKAEARLFQSLIPKPLGSNIPKSIDVKPLDNTTTESSEIETANNVIKEEVDFDDSVSDVSGIPHWQPESESQYQLSDIKDEMEDDEDDDEEEYANKSLEELKRTALIAQTKMFKAEEAAARSKEKLNLYKLAMLKQRHKDDFHNCNL